MEARMSVAEGYDPSKVTVHRERPSVEGKHFDEGKPRIDLVDTYAIEQLGHVLAFGAKKYGEHNWRGGILYLKLLGSALRHLFAFASGIDNDHESGLPHLAHAMCCCMMLLGTTKLHPEMDNRYKGTSIG